LLNTKVNGAMSLARYPGIIKGMTPGESAELVDRLHMIDILT
jgi:hypothetical protein